LHILGPARQVIAMKQYLALLLSCALASVSLSALTSHAAQKRSNAYPLQVMTPEGKVHLPMAEAAVYTALVAVKTALYTPDDLEKLAAGAKGCSTPSTQPGSQEGSGRGFGVKKAAEGIISYVTATGKSPDTLEKSDPMRGDCRHGRRMSWYAPTESPTCSAKSCA